MQKSTFALAAVLYGVLVLLSYQGSAQKRFPHAPPDELKAVTNPVYKSILIVSQDTQRQKRLERVGIPGEAAELIAALGYTDSSIILLKANGVDLVQGMRHRPRAERIKTVLSDCIIIGLVKSVEEDSSKTLYHSIAHVQVTRYLRNDYNLPAGEVLVGFGSGPVGHGRYVAVSDEDELAPGETALLFLSAAGLLIDTKYSPYSSFHRKLLTSQRVLLKIQGTTGGKYPLQGNPPNVVGGQRSLDEIISDIEYVTRILNKTPSRKGE